MVYRVFVLLFPLLAVAATLSAQVTVPKESADIQSEIASLRAQLDSLRLELQARSSSDDETFDLEERLENRIRDLESKIDAIARATAPTVFNPRTTGFLNFSGRADSKPVQNEEGDVAIDNRLFLRSIELDFRGAVDPYAEAVLVFAMEDEAGTGFAFEPEEAYAIIKQVPILEAAPLGVKARIGKFRAPFGVSNKLHMHDLPWTTRPLVISKYLGTEHGDFFESGFNPIGFDFDFFLPSPIPGATAEMNLSFVKSGELRVARPDAEYTALTGKQPALVGHLTLSSDWNNEHLLVGGVSSYFERGMHYSNGLGVDDRVGSKTQLLGLDVTYKWTPARGGSARSFVAGGEFIFGKVSSRDEGGEEYDSSPLGWYAYAQYQFSFWTYLGIRYDRVREPFDFGEVTQSIGGYLSYYTTEFLRFRLGLDHRISTIPSVNGRTSFLFEVNVVFGSHPVEPYWVTR